MWYTYSVRRSLRSMKVSLLVLLGFTPNRPATHIVATVRINPSKSTRETSNAIERYYIQSKIHRETRTPECGGSILYSRNGSVPPVPSRYGSKHLDLSP